MLRELGAILKSNPPHDCATEVATFFLYVSNSDFIFISKFSCDHLKD
jgi:hypothetical protein